MLIEFLVVALILYLIDSYIPMEGAFKVVFHIICVALAIYFLLALFNVSLPDFPNRLR